MMRTLRNHKSRHFFGVRSLFICGAVGCLARPAFADVAEELERAGMKRGSETVPTSPPATEDSEGWKSVPPTSGPVATEDASTMPAVTPSPGASTAKPKIGVLGPIRLGPVVGLAFPQPLNVGIEGRYGRDLGFGINYGFLPQFTIFSVSARYSAIDLAGRWFPWGQASFIGASVGRQAFNGGVPTAIDATPVTVRGEVSSFYLTPMIGGRWEMPSGFMLGVEGGVQIPVFGDTDFSIEGLGAAGFTGSTAVDQVIDKIDLVGNVLGFIVLPRVAIRVGWMF